VTSSAGFDYVPGMLIVPLKGNCSKNFLLQNIFGFHVYITNTYVKLSTETVIMQKNNFDDNSVLCYK